MQKWISYLDHYFFCKTRNHNLGLIRIVLVLLCAYQGFRDYGWMHDLTYMNAELDSMHEPSFLIKMLRFPFPLDSNYVRSFAYFYYATAFCALIGLFTRPALFILSFATIYVVDIDVSRGFFNHEASLASQVMFILALAPGSTSFSVDRLLQWFYMRNKPKASNLLQTLIGPSVSAWGVKLLLILLACTYFTAGVSKIRYGGLAWLDGQTLTHYLDGSANPYVAGKKPPIFIGPNDVPQKEKWRDGFGIYTYSYGNRQTKKFWKSVGNGIAANRFLITSFAVAATVFELCAFLLLLNGWPRVLYLLGAILMHKSIGVLMNLPFRDYQALCFLLIDWWWVYKNIPIGNNIKQKLNLYFSNFKFLNREYKVSE